MPAPRKPKKNKHTGSRPYTDYYYFVFINAHSIVIMVVRRAIEQEKQVYKESFEKLRQVKPEIEHIKKVELLTNKIPLIFFITL